MTYRHFRPDFLSLVLLLSTSVGHAAEQDEPNIDFNAYGTLSAVHSSEERADFISSSSQVDGAGFSDDIAFGVDSRVGLQLTAAFSPRLSAVVQVVSEQQYDGSYSPTVEWGNVQLEVTPDFSLRAGRIVLPTFMVSDYRKVAYANHWVRPPLEVYNMVPVTNSDGLDASYRMQSGTLANTLQGFSGQRTFKFAVGEFQASKLQGVVDTLQSGAWELRLAYLRSNLTANPINALMGLFRQFGAQGSAIAARYDLDDTLIEATVLGGRYDADDWFTMAEWVRTASPSFLGKDRGWYLTGGFRYGRLTPYATYSRKKSLENSTTEYGLDLTGLPPALRGFGTAINAQLGELLRSNDSDTLAIGTRWDFADTFSVTLQFDHVRADDGSYAMLGNVQPGLAPFGSFNVLTAAISFVY